MVVGEGAAGQQQSISCTVGCIHAVQQECMLDMESVMGLGASVLLEGARTCTSWLPLASRRSKQSSLAWGKDHTCSACGQAARQYAIAAMRHNSPYGYSWCQIASGRHMQNVHGSCLLTCTHIIEVHMGLREWG